MPELRTYSIGIDENGSVLENLTREQAITAYQHNLDYEKYFGRQRTFSSIEMYIQDGDGIGCLYMQTKFFI